jgi:perosamine synthetase
MIPLHKPSIKRKDMDSVLTCLVSDALGPGSLASDLVAKIADRLGMQGGVALRSYDDAIALVLGSLGLEEGDVVILSPLAPSAYLRVVEREGLVPRFVDVDASSGVWNQEALIDPAKEGVGALIVSHRLGLVPPMHDYLELGIPVLEDVTEALGGTLEGKALGSFGAYSILRMEAQDLVTCGGGTVVLGAKRKELSLLRRNSEGLAETAQMSDMNAALGIAQVHAFETALGARRELVAFLEDAARKSGHGTFSRTVEEDRVPAGFPLILKGSANEAVAYARKHNVHAALVFEDACIGVMENQDAWPNALGLALRTLAFPLYPTLGKRNLEQVAKVVSTLP